MTTTTCTPLPAADRSVEDVHDRWVRIRRRLGALLQPDVVDPAGVQALLEVAQSVRLGRRADQDDALYLVLQWAGEDVRGYSASHALACAVIAELAAQHLGASDDECASVVIAALTMNLSIGQLQNRLAEQRSTPTSEQRKLLVEHPSRSARLLAEAGVSDDLWLSIVRGHHIATPWSSDPASRLSELLRRIDIYTAKLGQRASRRAVSTTAAAKGACLDEQGAPDAIGATLLRVLGLYPPGTWVQLRCGEVAVVRRRGAKAHTPVVVSIRRDDGMMLYQPTRRDTSERAYAVQRAMPAAECKARLEHSRILAL